MSTAEHTLRKRALYTGLQPFLKDTELMEALILWETRYASQSKYSLRYFVGDIAKHLRHEHQAKNMLISLVSSMAMPAHELLPDPTLALDAYKRRRRESNNNIGSRKHYRSPEVEAVKLLIDKWLSLVSGPIKFDVENYVANNLAQLQIDPHLSSHLRHWLRNRNHEISGLSETKLMQLRKVINLFYVALCEYIGPTRADETLCESVKRLKNNGGAQFSELFAKLL